MNHFQMKAIVMIHIFTYLNIGAKGYQNIYATQKVVIIKFVYGLRYYMYAPNRSRCFSRSTVSRALDLEI